VLEEMVEHIENKEQGFFERIDKGLGRASDWASEKLGHAADWTAEKLSVMKAQIEQRFSWKWFSPANKG
jgi:hypothetical protein